MTQITNGLDTQWNFQSNSPSMRGVTLVGGMQRIPFVLALSVNAGGTQATVTESGISSFFAYNIYFVDAEGNESAMGTITAISTPVNISTSNLNPNVAWKMKVLLQQNNANLDAARNKADFTADVNVPKSFSQTYSNAEGQGTPSAKVDGTTVADTGTHTYGGTVNVGDVVVLPITILNTATAENGAFFLQTVSISGDGSFSSQGVTPAPVVPLGESGAWGVLLDSAAAGAKTATITFTSTRSSNVSYTFDIDYTVS